MTSWLLPALAFVVTTGLLGVTTKLALRSADWPDLVLWAAFAYALAAMIVIALGVGRLQWNSDTPWALATGVLPVLSLVLLFIALGAAEVSRVIPVTASYPLVTGVLSALVLSETITFTRGLAMLLIVTGVIMISR